MEILVLAVLLGLIPGMIAQHKGKSFLLWWLFGAAIFIVALPCAILITPDQGAADKRAITVGGMVKCPYCAELVKKEAVKCKHCGSSIEAPPEQSGLHAYLSNGQRIDL